MILKLLIHSVWINYFTKSNPSKIILLNDNVQVLSNPGSVLESVGWLHFSPNWIVLASYHGRTKENRRQRRRLVSFHLIWILMTCKTSSLKLKMWKILNKTLLFCLNIPQTEIIWGVAIFAVISSVISNLSFVLVTACIYPWQEKGIKRSSHLAWKQVKVWIIQNRWPFSPERSGGNVAEIDEQVISKQKLNSLFTYPSLLPHSQMPLYHFIHLRERKQAFFG